MSILLSVAIPWIPKVMKRSLEVREARSRQSLAEARQVLGAAVAGTVPALPPVVVPGYHKVASTARLGAVDDGGGWAYVSGQPAGRVFINCTHTDSSGQSWASY